MRCLYAFCCLLVLAVPAVGQEASRPVARAELPAARWENDVWTRATMSAVLGHGRALVETVPGDIDTWCPAYADNDPRRRAAFWTGVISALARHESTYRPGAVGGNGRWFGLLQIAPATARGYGCAARSGAALKDGVANLRCAVRIMAVTVARDEAVARAGGRNAGIAADWGPMTKRAKRAEMAGFTRAQEYCLPRRSLVPKPRPEPAAQKP